MTAIKQEDVIQNVYESLQHMSYYHPLDYITALGRAYALEKSPAAKDAIAQILTNSRMAAEGHQKFETGFRSWGMAASASL
jgi:fumarate hydratase class I